MYIATNDHEKLNLGVVNSAYDWGMYIAGLYETEEERAKIIFANLFQRYEDWDLRYSTHEEQLLDNYKEKYNYHYLYCCKCIEDANKFIISEPKLIQISFFINPTKWQITYAPQFLD